MGTRHSAIPVIAGIGEVLWDVLDETEEVGGAPVNFAYHINTLGACGMPVSTIGDDPRGRRTLHALSEHSLDVSAISTDAAYPTGYARATLDAKGVASYTFPDNMAWDHLQLNPAALAAAAGVRAVSFGTLAQRSAAARQAVARFLELAPPETLCIFDPNLRQNFYNKPTVEASLHWADVLKLSENELFVLARMLDLNGNDRDQLAALLARFQLTLVVLTRGHRGSMLLTADALVEHPGVKTRVADTIGAGDAFTAAITLGLLLGHSPEALSEHANALAAYVCSQPGAMPAVPEHFKLL